MKKMKENEKMKENQRKSKKRKKTKKMKENEKMKKNEKLKKWKKRKKKRMKKKNWRKMMKKRKKNEKKWIQTQYPRRFPGFTVVVVTCFVKILDDLHDFVSECVSFLRKINNLFCGLTVFPKKSGNFHWTWNKNTHFSDENPRKKIAQVSPSNNNHSFRIL